MRAEKWDAELYDAKHAFVWGKAKGLFELLAAKPGERMLDLGCGTLTAEIAASGAEVVGADRSPEMIKEAGKKFPALRFDVSDARALPFSREHGSPDRSSRKNSATTYSVGLYTRQCTCYIFLPYRHPCARRLGL